MIILKGLVNKLWQMYFCHSLLPWSVYCFWQLTSAFNPRRSSSLLKSYHYWLYFSLTFIAWSADLVCLKQCLNSVYRPETIYQIALNRVERLLNISRTDIGQNLCYHIDANDKILKELDNIPKEWLSSIPSKKAIPHSDYAGIWQPTWSLQKSAFSVLMRQKLNSSHWRTIISTGIEQVLLIAQLSPDNTGLRNGLLATRMRPVPWGKHSRTEENKSSLQRHRASHNQDNGLALEQIPKCPPVARPKPGLEAIWKSAGRPEDHGLPTRLIQSDNLQT